MRTLPLAARRSAVLTVGVSVVVTSLLAVSTSAGASPASTEAEPARFGAHTSSTSYEGEVTGAPPRRSGFGPGRTPRGTTPQPAPAPPPTSFGSGTGQLRSDLNAVYTDLLALASTLGSQGARVAAVLPTVQEHRDVLAATPDDAFRAAAGGPVAATIGKLRGELRQARLGLARTALHGEKAGEAGLRRQASVIRVPGQLQADHDDCEYLDRDYTPLRTAAFAFEVVVIATGAAADILGNVEPTGIASVPVIGVRAAAEGLLASVSFESDMRDCTLTYLFERTDNADKNLVKTFDLLRSSAEGINELLGKVDGMQAPAAPGGGDGGVGGGSSDPQSLDEVLAAIADARLQVQQTIGGNSQVLTNKLQTLQESINAALEEILARLDGSSQAPAPQSDRLAVQQGLVANGPPIADLLLPASAGGLLDAPGGVRATVEKAVTDARAAGLAFDDAGASGALEDANRALADGDFKGAFTLYRKAYLAVVS